MGTLFVPGLNPDDPICIIYRRFIFWYFKHIEYWCVQIYWILMCTNILNIDVYKWDCNSGPMYLVMGWVEIFILYLVRSRSWLIMSLAALGTQLYMNSISHRNLIRFNLIKSRLSLIKPSLNLIKLRFGLIISHLNLIKTRLNLIISRVNSCT